MIDRDNIEIDEEEDFDEAESEGEETLQLGVASTPVDFARLGITKMAYIRQTVVNNETMWGIFSAAGDPLGAAPSFELAWAAVKQHHLQPVHVH
jgi:hypothetical protein